MLNPLCTRNSKKSCWVDVRCRWVYEAPRDEQCDAAFNNNMLTAAGIVVIAIMASGANCHVRCHYHSTVPVHTCVIASPMVSLHWVTASAEPCEPRLAPHHKHNCCARKSNLEVAILLRKRSEEPPSMVTMITRVRPYMPDSTAARLLPTTSGKRAPTVPSTA